MSDRDYNLTGTSGKRALESGLAKAKWYQSPISSKDMEALTQRSDMPAIRDTLMYYALMILFAAIGIALWPTWWCAPFWIAYATLYASGADSRWHECGHRTAFKTRWMNQTVYQVACFCLLRNPVVWRRSHVRHHADTIIVGRDPEIITMRPPQMLKLIPLFFGWDTISQFANMIRYVVSGVNEEEASFIPEREHKDVRRIAGLWLCIIIATVIAAISLRSVLPFMLVLGPVIFGSWHYILTGLLQHTGMADNVIDHRLNSRTVHMNPISRFIYWNMNYHVEHHMFPMVPYHALPALHEKIKHDLPAPNRSISAGMKEVIAALISQLSNPEYRIEKPLPDTANPYKTIQTGRSVAAG